MARDHQMVVIKENEGSSLFEVSKELMFQRYYKRIGMSDIFVRNLKNYREILAVMRNIFSSEIFLLDIVR